MESIEQAHGRVFAARKRLAEFLAKHMDDSTVEEAMKMVLDLSAMAHSDGAEWGAVRERTAAQLRTKTAAQLHTEAILASLTPAQAAHEACGHFHHDDRVCPPTPCGDYRCCIN